ncbi:MAG: metal ABC transporter permease [Candidatus Dadabacteria bacterium]|nr:metal ABC transporter permease [Candidatus Dadabacteria bacterium]MDE0476863.1 metal ABC transporter permease [Candidatus Dadabacteria bacterium]
MLIGELLEIIGPAMVAGLMIALTHAPLGIEVLRRGIIFIDLAVAQIAGLGLVVGNMFIHDPSPWLIQFIALGCAVAAGLFFRKVETAMPERQEAIIGCTFVLAASLALLLLADHPHGGEEVKHLLSGQMLFVTWTEVAKHAPIYALILLAWFSKPEVRNNMGFYLIFALAITSSVQLVGVYVVFASLILPALAAVQVERPYLTAWFCGVAAVLSGIAFAVAFDMPAGPIIILSYTATALIIRGVRIANRDQKT